MTTMYAPAINAANTLSTYLLNKKVNASVLKDDASWKHVSWRKLQDKLTTASVVVEESEINEFVGGLNNEIIINVDCADYKLEIVQLSCESVLNNIEHTNTARVKYNAYALGTTEGKVYNFAEATAVKASEDMISVLGEPINNYCTVAVPGTADEMNLVRQQLISCVDNGIYLTKWGPMYKYDTDGNYAPLYMLEDQNSPSKWARLLKRESSVNKYGTYCKATVGSASAMNNGVICFVAAEKRDEYEEKMGYGISATEIIKNLMAQNKTTYNVVAKALSRVNMHSTYEAVIPNSTFEECGALVVEKNYFGDGQFIVNFGDKAPKVFQARGWNSVVKGMAINNTNVFNYYTSKIASGDLKVVRTIGNADNIIAIIGEDSIKVNDNIAANTQWYIMRSVHNPNDANATAVTLNKFGFICNMQWAEACAFEHYKAQLVEKLHPQCDSSFLNAKFYGLNRRMTIYALNKAIADIEEQGSKKKYEFPIGGRVAKILRSDNKNKSTVVVIDGNTYPVADIRFMNAGLVLIRRVPDVGAAEWIIAYNMPRYYYEKNKITSVSDDVVYIPYGKVGDTMAVTGGGFDYDGDSVAVYQLSVSDKSVAANIGTKTAMGEAFIGKYNSIATEVITPERTVMRKIKSVEDFLFNALLGAKGATIGAIVNAFTNGVYLSEKDYANVWNGAEAWVAPDDLYSDTVDEEWCISALNALFDENGNVKVFVKTEAIADFRFMLGKAGRFYSEVETGFGKSGVHPEQKALGKYIKFINKMYKNGAVRHDDGFRFSNVIAALKSFKDELVAAADAECIWTCGLDDIQIATRNTTAQLLRMVDRAHTVGHIEDALHYVGNHIASMKVIGDRNDAMEVISGMRRETSYIELVDDFLEEAGYIIDNRKKHEDNGKRVIRIIAQSPDAKITSVNMFVVTENRNGTRHKVAQINGLQITDANGDVLYPMIDFSGLVIEEGEYTIESMFEGDVYHHDSKNKDMKDIVLFLQKR